jgi:UDP-glucose 4-epimerase
MTARRIEGLSMVQDRSRNVLVTGGAGYIGSHAVLALLDAGYNPVVIDDLSTGARELVPAAVPLIVGDIANAGLVGKAIADHGCGAVMHFAGSIVVSESVENPLKYYRNNTAASRTLIESCVQAGVISFIFSSTAVVYGEPDTIPIPESAPTTPVNPYGSSKLMTEWILRDVARVSDMRYCVLRYFNVAGADPQGRSGQSGPQSTHLIRNASQLVAGRRDSISIFGTDYDTPDGTCVRDYVHVSDLAEAHLLALRHLTGSGENLVLNCGYGRGFSVREVLNAVEAIAGRKLPIVDGPRRAGDVPKLVADASEIRNRLGWRPRFDDLPAIIKSAVDWEAALGQAPGGRKGA